MTSFSTLSRRWPVKPGQRAALHLLSLPPSLHVSLLHLLCPALLPPEIIRVYPRILKVRAHSSNVLHFRGCFFFFLLQESLGQQSIRGGVIEGAVRG